MESLFNKILDWWEARKVRKSTVPEAPPKAKASIPEKSPSEQVMNALNKEKGRKWKIQLAVAVIILLTIESNIADRIVVVNSLTDPIHNGELASVPDGYEGVLGSVFISTLINLVEIEQNRSLGGYRPDNIIWFNGLMPFDNVKNFQIGVQEVVQRTTILLKERVARAGGGSDSFDEYLVKASESFNYKKDSFFLTGGQIRDGLSALKNYRIALKDGKATFALRSDALFDLIRTFREQLGDTHNNLAKWKNPDGTKISTFETDDYFYQALGEIYAIMALMRAVRLEFAEVLNSNGSIIFMDEVEKSLDLPTRLNPPLVVLNGSIYSLFANHRSNLETSVNDARFKLVSMMDNLRR